MEKELFVGVMSGTSMDAIDAVLVSISHNEVKTLASQSSALPEELKQNLSALCVSNHNEIERLGQIDIVFAELIAETINTLLNKENIAASSIRAIGSHGQTIRHCPELPKPFSLQIGNPNVIAHNTGITTVADFRMADIAAGGQGAPLVPAFHQAVFAPESGSRAIINIGGISNLTLLHSTTPLSKKPHKQNHPNVIGYDIGPGNTLMDQWIKLQKNLPLDTNGSWAKSGTVIPTLLEEFKSDAFIKKQPPKSSGREYYNLTWLNKYLNNQEQTQDVQRTLAELTAQIIADALRHETHNQPCEVFLCGGGVNNNFLRERIDSLLPTYQISTTNNLGIDAQLVEATAFAWLAKQALHGINSNNTNVTGAKCQKILGGIYPA